MAKAIQLLKERINGSKLDPVSSKINTFSTNHFGLENKDSESRVNSRFNAMLSPFWKGLGDLIDYLAEGGSEEETHEDMPERGAWVVHLLSVCVWLKS